MKALQQTLKYTYTLFEDSKIMLGEGIRFCDNGDQINTSTKALHDLNVERLQPAQPIRERNASEKTEERTYAQLA